MQSMQPDALRATLARNLRNKIEHDLGEGSRYSVRAWALGKGLDVRLIDRLVKGEHAVTIDKLDEIASACGMPAWQLLLPEMNPSEPSAAQPITEDERALLKRLRRLLGPDAV